MKTKRVIISLREDELSLLSTILKEYMTTVSTDETRNTPIQEQAHSLLKDSVQKLINKLEAKNEK